MKLIEIGKRNPIRVAILMLVAIFPACKNNVPPAPQIDDVAAGPDQSQVDARRLNDGASKLTDAMKKPAKSFHFSYNGEENQTTDSLQPPQVGKEILQADISPVEILLKETRGKETTELKAEADEDVNWNIAHLTIVRILSNPMLAIAVGASVAGAPTEDLVGETAADKFVFDTGADLTRAQKIGLARARSVVSAIQNCKGTAWIAKDSGELVKFEIDADYQDKYSQSWSEHYEGIVTPK
jgi:hypothetical protein